jgi:hypothetical protein
LAYWAGVLDGPNPRATVPPVKLVRMPVVPAWPRVESQVFDPVGADVEAVAAGAQGHLVPVVLAGQCGEHRGGHDLTGQHRRELVHDLVVAARHVELLVGLPEDRGGGAVAEAGQVDEVQRRLRRDVRAVLDGVRQVEELAELRGHAAIARRSSE